MSNEQLADKLDALAEANRTAPDDYYGAQFWSVEDIQLLREAARALRASVRVTADKTA